MDTPMPSPRKWAPPSENTTTDESDIESQTGTEGSEYSESESVGSDFLDSVQGGEFDYGEYAKDYVSQMYDEKTIPETHSSDSEEGSESSEDEAAKQKKEEEPQFPPNSWQYITKEVQNEMIEMHTVLHKYGLIPKRTAKNYPLENYTQNVPPLDSCNSKDFLDSYIFPTLLPAIQSLLFYCKKNRIFQCGRCAFNPLDYLVEFLYNNNPMHPQRYCNPIPLSQIPFAKAWIAKYPRPPLPKSMTMSTNDAARTIQRFLRGYNIRKDPEVQEMRKFWDDIKKNLPPENIKQTAEERAAGDEPLFSPYYNEVVHGQKTEFTRESSVPHVTHSDKCLICSKFRDDLTARKKAKAQNKKKKDENIE